MVSSAEENLVYGIRLSSVGPSEVTGTNVVHEPSSMDLAMKLHYLKCVYFFSSETAQGISVGRMKESMFSWLNHHYVTCGRFRRSESGKPYIKCNDCGIRFVEAKCDKTLQEWIEMATDADNHHFLLVYHQPIGPDLTFSPLIYIQVTYFKCGGMAVGLNWAHVLGDGLSISDWVNSWGPWLAGRKPNTQPNFINSEKPKSPTPITKEPLAAKRVGPVGDNWVTTSSCRMETFSFHITPIQLSHLQSKISGKNKVPRFECVCAIIWQCVAIVREGCEPKIVTICKKDPSRKKGQLSNYQLISSVQANFSVSDANVGKLATLLVDEAVDEGSKIEAAMERDDGMSDFVVYGANLTFVDLEEADLYGLEMNGQKPEFVHYSIENVGDGGVVLVLPGGKEDVGKFVTVTLPENQVMKVKDEIKKHGLMLENDLD